MPDYAKPYGPQLPPERLLSVKEIAAALGHSRTYVEAMKRRGFLMPGGRTTLERARAWLERNPHPRARERRPRLAA
jgi:hypothetical protein